MVNLQRIQEAQGRITPYIKETPLLRGEGLDELLGCQVYLKPENLQITGSFKIRGAMNKLLSLKEEEKNRGVIAASSGNHGQAVAYAAKRLGVKAVVVMPENAPTIKVAGTKKYGAEVILYGTSSKDRYEETERLINHYGYTLIHSYDDKDLIAGQGTVGLELIRSLPEVDIVVSPIGGGGLLSGVSTAIKESNGKVKVVGVEPKSVARYTKSIAQGTEVEVEMGDTLADGLRVIKPGKNGFEILQKYVDEIALVENDEIVWALKEVATRAKLVVEPSAVVGIGAVLNGRIAVSPEKKVCFILSGGNVDMDRFAGFL